MTFSEIPFPFHRFNCNWLSGCQEVGFIPMDLKAEIRRVNALYLDRTAMSCQGVAIGIAIGVASGVAGCMGCGVFLVATSSAEPIERLSFARF